MEITEKQKDDIAKRCLNFIFKLPMKLFLKGQKYSNVEQRKKELYGKT